VALRCDELYVTSTGLDMVVVLDKRNGAILCNINAEGKPTWHRFSPEDDSISRRLMAPSLWRMHKPSKSLKFCRSHH